MPARRVRRFVPASPSWAERPQWAAVIAGVVRHPSGKKLYYRTAARRSIAATRHGGGPRRNAGLTFDGWAKRSGSPITTVSTISHASTEKSRPCPHSIRRSAPTKSAACCVRRKSSKRASAPRGRNAGCRTARLRRRSDPRHRRGAGSVGLKSVTTAIPPSELDHRLFEKALGRDGLGFEDSFFFHKNEKATASCPKNWWCAARRACAGRFRRAFLLRRALTRARRRSRCRWPILHFLGGDARFWATPMRRPMSSGPTLSKCIARIGRAGEVRLHSRADRRGLIVKIGDPEIRATLTGRGDDWKSTVEKYVEVLNAVIAAAPPAITVGIHVCRGNRRGFWQADAGYEFMADQLFRRLAGRFISSNSTARAPVRSMRCKRCPTARPSSSA